MLELRQFSEEGARHVLRHYRDGKRYLETLTPQRLRELERDPWACIIEADGEPVAIGGVLQYWPGRGEVWAIIADHAGRYMTGIHKLARAYLGALPLRRVEAAVVVDFRAGHRWARMLGFRLEARRLRKYGFDGQDHSLYARVR